MPSDPITPSRGRPWTEEECIRWADACTEAQGAGPRWYSDDPADNSNQLDYEACKRDAEAGNERAQRYMLAYLVERMTG